MASDNTKYWLALKAIPRLALTKKLALIDHIGIEKLFQNPPALEPFALTQKQQAAIHKPDWKAINNIIECSKHIGCSVIGFDSELYPQHLKEIFDPPLVIFAKGNLALLDKTQIAIVGSRNASLSGREVAKSFAEKLAQHGLVITSGLALGIDGYAHAGALSFRNSTIAVVATGLDQVYPPRHRGLVTRILENDGLIISEFAPNTPPRAGHFPKRNRIISGLAHGVLVVEAAMKSGSLITARTALEQNREVYAIPSNIYNEQAKGCHWLIKQGAKLVDDVADILEELDIHSIQVDCAIEPERNIKNITEQGLSNDPLLASVGDETTPVDLVVSRSKLPIEEVMSRLTILELRGLVSAVPGGYQKLSRGN